MEKSITLKEGFSLHFYENRSKININKFSFYHEILATNWMEVVDFIAVLESAQRNRLGLNKKYEFNNVKIYGQIMDKEYFVCLESGYCTEIFTFDMVIVQQIISKLNKLLQISDKLDTATTDY